MSEQLDVARIRRNPWIMALAATPFALCLAAIAGAILVGPALLLGVLHGTALGSASLYYAWQKNPWRRRERTRIVIEDDAVHIGAERIERSQIRAGFVTDGRGPALRLERRGLAPAIELELESAEDGRRALAALGLDPSRTVTDFRATSPVLVSLKRQLALMGLLLPLSAAVALLLSIVDPRAAALGAGLTMAIVTGIATLIPSRVHVGSDGVLFRWLGFERFVAHDDIAHTAVRDSGFGRGRRIAVRLTLRSGGHLDLPVGTMRVQLQRAERLRARIDEARQVGAEGGGSAVSRVLARRARPHLEWVEALLAATAMATHREAAVAPETLWQLVESPRAEPLSRAAAAIALEPTLGEAERSRLRIAAEATASPKLRIALEQVAGGADQEALAEALAEVEAGEAEKSAVL